MRVAYRATTFAFQAGEGLSPAPFNPDYAIGLLLWLQIPHHLCTCSPPRISAQMPARHLPSSARAGSKLRWSFALFRCSNLRCADLTQALNPRYEVYRIIRV